MSGLGAQRGQATVEWVGLLLALAVLFGALAAGGREAAKEESAHGLGEAVAGRITCAVRGACGAGERTPGERAPGADERAPRALAGAPSRSPRGTSRRLGGSGSLPARGVSGVLKRAWVLCLGYRRWRYDVEHPPAPRQALPVHETLDMVNDCVNPLSFLFG